MASFKPLNKVLAFRRNADEPAGVGAGNDLALLSEPLFWD